MTIAKRVKCFFRGWGFRPPCIEMETNVMYENEFQRVLNGVYLLNFCR